MRSEMNAASRIAVVILLVVLVSLVCGGCSSPSSTATTSSIVAISNAAAQKAIDSALDHMRAASEIREDINHQLELCDAAYDVEEPDRATGYAQDAQGLLPEHDAEQAAARELLMSVEATDADEDVKGHALLLLDWVESRIAEAATLSEYVAAEKVVAAAGASLTEVQVHERYRLDLALLESRRTVDEKVETANDFVRVQLSGQSSTTVPESDTLLLEYDYQLRTVQAWRDVMTTLWNLRTYKYNETGPNRKIEPGDLVVEELDTLVARMNELPSPPSSLASFDSAWRERVAQLLEAERALAEEDTQKHRDDVAWFNEKEFAALNELTAMTAGRIALINTTPATTQAATSTEATTATTAALELSPEVQTYLDEFNQLGQLFWDTWVKLDAANSTDAIEMIDALRNRPSAADVQALYTALATSAKNLSVPGADAELAHVKDDFIGACENVLESEKLSQEANSLLFGGEDIDLEGSSEKLASARAAFGASDADFQAFRAGLEAMGVDASWGK